MVRISKKEKYLRAKIKTLHGKEAVALVLHAVKKPIPPSHIARVLSRNWKKTNTKRVSSYLTSRGDTPTIRKYVRRYKDGYRLKPTGQVWVRKQVLKKLQ